MLFVPCLPQTVLLYSCQDIESFLWLLCRRPGKKKKKKRIRLNRSTCGFVLFPTCLTTGWLSAGYNRPRFTGKSSSLFPNTAPFVMSLTFLPRGQVRVMCFLAMTAAVVLDLGNLILPCQSTESSTPCLWFPTGVKGLQRPDGQTDSSKIGELEQK